MSSLSSRPGNASLGGASTATLSPSVPSRTHPLDERICPDNPSLGSAASSRDTSTSSSATWTLHERRHSLNVRQSTPYPRNYEDSISYTKITAAEQDLDPHAHELAAHLASLPQLASKERPPPLNIPRPLLPPKFRLTEKGEWEKIPEEKTEEGDEAVPRKASEGSDAERASVSASISSGERERREYQRVSESGHIGKRIDLGLDHAYRSSHEIWPTPPGPLTSSQKSEETTATNEGGSALSPIKEVENEATQSAQEDNAKSPTSDVSIPKAPTEPPVNPTDLAIKLVHLLSTSTQRIQCLSAGHDLSTFPFPPAEIPHVDGANIALESLSLLVLNSIIGILRSQENYEAKGRDKSNLLFYNEAFKTAREEGKRHIKDMQREQRREMGPLETMYDAARKRSKEEEWCVRTWLAVVIIVILCPRLLAGLGWEVRCGGGVYVIEGSVAESFETTEYAVRLGGMTRLFLSRLQRLQALGKNPFKDGAGEGMALDGPAMFGISVIDFGAKASMRKRALTLTSGSDAVGSSDDDSSDITYSEPSARRSSEGGGGEGGGAGTTQSVDDEISSGSDGDDELNDELSDGGGSFVTARSDNDDGSSDDDDRSPANGELIALRAEAVRVRRFRPHQVDMRRTMRKLPSGEPARVAEVLDNMERDMERKRIGEMVELRRTMRDLKDLEVVDRAEQEVRERKEVRETLRQDVDLEGTRWARRWSARAHVLGSVEEAAELASGSGMEGELPQLRGRRGRSWNSFSLNDGPSVEFEEEVELETSY